MREDRLNALLLLFIHRDIALDYDAIIDDYHSPAMNVLMIVLKPLQCLFLRLFLKLCPSDMSDTFRLFKFFDKSS